MRTVELREASSFTSDRTSPGVRHRAMAAVQRVTSIDVVRGMVMLLMAIDHVRVYSGQPAGGPTAGIFFTRWITNVVAPAFVFLAGTSAYLYEQKVGDKKQLARFLVTRGLWLVLLELTVLRVAWTFNFDFAHYMLAGVIWMLGWCMVLLSGIVFFPQAAIVVGSLAVIFLHNVIDFFPAATAAMRHGSWLWKVLYAGGGFRLGDHGPPLIVLFVLVPWVAVMAAGYAFGPVMRMSPERRRAICLRIGAAAIVGFVLLRGLDVYGDPRPWSHAPPQMPHWLAFLNTAKYPPSLSFLLMTLGPMFLMLGLVEAARGPVARVLETYGRVPLFYYMLHIPTIHFAAVLVSIVREGAVNAWLFTNHPMANPPAPLGYLWSLPLLYLVWVLCVTALYVPCRWYARLRREKRWPWLSYL